jgi:glutamine amidotransferase-like uncharacterized protein
MNSLLRGGSPISRVIVYKGHETHPLLGPYKENIVKRIDMFNTLNAHRQAQGKQTWTVTAIAGEQLIEALKENPEETLLVIPAGQSSRLDKVFSIAETTFIKDKFFCEWGGRGYFNCGSAYWVSQTRKYQDLHEEQPDKRNPVIKTTHLPLFHGLAQGPLCPYPGTKYRVGFFSDAVRVTDDQNECTIYLSGGGSFIVPKQEESKQRVKILARYLDSELERHGKKAEEFQEWKNAVIMVSVGKGAALLSMFHPYYGPNDINVESYEKAFPDSGTNWKEVKEKLSPLDIRMKFVLNSMLNKLEEMDFEKKSPIQHYICQL